MAGLCEGGNEPSGSLKAIFTGNLKISQNGVREPFLIEELRSRLMLPSTAAEFDYARSCKRRRRKSESEFYGTDAMINRNWTAEQQITKITRMADSDTSLLASEAGNLNADNSKLQAKRPSHAFSIEKLLSVQRGPEEDDRDRPSIVSADSSSVGLQDEEDMDDIVLHSPSVTECCEDVSTTLTGEETDAQQQLPARDHGKAQQRITA
ncbi:hypothetical protein ANN_20939 [Periplaneta americana]|uniref:Uncharacterized protein n=1 Tax=Periplaneta americana TaxID=6978 RepID=A0ABQ8SES2_PERAM|nr:hypothetical protein ANN_20939 [Periplaneta americana]